MGGYVNRRIVVHLNKRLISLDSRPYLIIEELFPRWPSFPLKLASEDWPALSSDSPQALGTFLPKHTHCFVPRSLSSQPKAPASDKTADFVEQQHHKHSTHHSQHRRCRGFGSRSTIIRGGCILGIIAQVFQCSVVFLAFSEKRRKESGNILYETSKDFKLSRLISGGRGRE